MINYTNITDAWGIQKETFNNIQSTPKKAVTKKEHFTNCDDSVCWDDFPKLMKQMKEDKLNMQKIASNIDKILEKVQVIDKLNKKISILEKKLEKKSRNMINERSMQNIETFSNGNDFYLFNFIIDKIKNMKDLNVSKHLKVFLIFLSVIVLTILIVNSFRKPVMIEGLNKKVYVFPEEFNNIQKLLEKN